MPQRKTTETGKNTRVIRERIEDDRVYYEKATTVHIGDNNYAKITVGISSQLEPSEETIVSIKKTCELLDEIVSEEIEIALNEFLK